MEKQKLSIIIPVYNVEKYLPTNLNSILAANLEKTELILVDDGSKDDSLRICQSYAAKYPCIRLLCQQGSGPSVARNRGLDESNGEYIVFFDSDDYILPAAFRKTVFLLDMCPEGECWVSDFWRVAENGCILDRVYQIKDTSEPIEDRTYMRRFLHEPDCVWNVWRYIFRRDFLLDHGLRFCESARCAEDLEFVVRALSESKKTIFYHNPYYFYRVNYGKTLTRTYTAARVCQLMEMLQISARYLCDRQEATADLMLDKLVLEYLLNLALFWEVPANEREEVQRLLSNAGWMKLLTKATGLKLAGTVVSLLGTAPSAWLLHQMKKIKRWVREIKIATYSNRMERKTKHGHQSVSDHSSL